MTEQIDWSSDGEFKVGLSRRRRKLNQEINYVTSSIGIESALSSIPTQDIAPVEVPIDKDKIKFSEVAGMAGGLVVACAAASFVAGEMMPAIASAISNLPHSIGF